MASLLERMNIATDSVGPVRSKGDRSGSSPYVRQRLALVRPFHVLTVSTSLAFS